MNLMINLVKKYFFEYQNYILSVLRTKECFDIVNTSISFLHLLLLDRKSFFDLLKHGNFFYLFVGTLSTKFQPDFKFTSTILFQKNTSLITQNVILYFYVNLIIRNVLGWKTEKWQSKPTQRYVKIPLFIYKRPIPYRGCVL